MTCEKGTWGKQLVATAGSLAVAGIAIRFLFPAATLVKLSQIVAPAAIAQTSQASVIYNNGKFASGYDMGVDTSEKRRDWVKKQSDGSLCMAYPSGQEWGAVFVTVGKPKPQPRPGKDFSSYTTLAIEMRGEQGGEQVEIGIKDKDDPDDGSEHKETVSLTSDWKTHTFPLTQFYTADLTNLYVVTEFVWGAGKPSSTVCFKKIEYRR